MWQREDIGQQTFLNTQDTVYEVLSKTPEHILCKNQDAVKIDMMLKKSETAEPNSVYGVKMVPYRNMASGVITDPNAGGNFSQNVALAIAFIAADRDDWQRFIPVGLKTRELSKTKKRQSQIVVQQNQPFKTRPKKDNNDDDNEEEEEFESVDRQDDYENASISGTEDETAAEEGSEDECNEPLMVFDHVAKEWVPATDEEQKDFGFDQNNAAQKETEPFKKPKPSLSQKSALPDPKQEAAASKQLHDRVAKVLKEQEEKALEEANMLPSDRIRRQVATLNDPASEANASEITQRYRGADMGINIEEEREKAKQRACGVKTDASKSAVSLLDRFAPEPELSMEPIANEKGKAPQYSLQQLMEFGSKTKLPPSIQKTLEQKNNNAAGTAGPVAAATAQTQAPQQQRPSDIVSKIAAKYRAVRRKELELALLMLELDELLQ